MITKTICTIGPTSDGEDILDRLIRAGMDIARFNFSHATHDYFFSTKKKIEQLSKKQGKKVEIMMDLQGPRMRVGEIGPEGIQLVDNEHVFFTTDKNNTKGIFINDPYLHEDIAVNHPMYLANGDLELIVTKKEGSLITAKVVRGGILHSKKGVNLPETNLTTRGLTDKDKKDIAFGLTQNVDYIAMSFVKDKVDLENLRRLINNDDVKIISKVEIKIALQNLDEIIDASDLVMVARGDLGIEVPLEELPLIQKDMIKRCAERRKPAIVATQMLMSMVGHYRPTRAEVSDVANAVIDGVWAVMLSDETAFGKYPVEALSYLVRTAQKAEEYKRT